MHPFRKIGCCETQLSRLVAEILDLQAYGRPQGIEESIIFPAANGEFIVRSLELARGLRFRGLSDVISVGVWSAAEDSSPPSVFGRC